MLHVETLDFPGRLPGFFAYVEGVRVRGRVIVNCGIGSAEVLGESLVSIDPVFGALFLVCDGQHKNNVVLNTVHESVGESRDDLSSNLPTNNWGRFRELGNLIHCILDRCHEGGSYAARTFAIVMSCVAQFAPGRGKVPIPDHLMSAMI